MVPTCPRMVFSIAERDRWFLPVQGWFPAFLRETDGSYLSKDGSQHSWERQYSYLYKDGSQHSWERQMVPTCLRMVPSIPERDRHSYLYKDGSQHSWERQMVPTCPRVVWKVTKAKSNLECEVCLSDSRASLLCVHDRITLLKKTTPLQVGTIKKTYFYIYVI